MSISRESFDPANGYKRLRFHEDRDLCDFELNEAQDIAIYERHRLFDLLLDQGAILSGLATTPDGQELAIAEGEVYVDGHLVAVDADALTFVGAGTHGVWLEVLKRTITAVEDPTLVNPLTDEPTAERERWVATWQTRDTSGDPLPAGATGRTVVELFSYNSTTEAVTKLALAPPDPGDHAALEEHIGAGGDVHALATAEADGFMPSTVYSALAGYHRQVVWGTNHATLADFLASADKWGMSEIRSARGGFEHRASGNNSAQTWLASMVITLAAPATLTIPLVSFGDGVFIYVDASLEFTGTTGVQSASIALAAGEYLVQVLWNNSASTNAGIVVADWFGNDVQFVRAATS